MASVRRSHFKSCFISAPFGVDTTVLRLTLDQRNVRWRDQTSVRAGRNWLEVIEAELSRADFVCVVLPTEQHGNILLELGIAYAKRRPVLAFLGPGVALPSDISGLTYFRSDPTDAEAVGRALDMFLQHATPVVAPLHTSGSGRRKRTAPEGAQPAPVVYEHERQTAILLQRAGFVVSGPAEEGAQGVDFAIWIDELQATLGSPLLVDVKVGDLSHERLKQAASRLRAYVAKTHGRCGLLVYWDSQNREFPAASPEWPLILQLSGRKLTQLSNEGHLIQEFLRLRNAAVHSVG